MDNKELLIELKNIKRALTCKESSSTSSPCCPETNDLLSELSNILTQINLSLNDLDINIDTINLNTDDLESLLATNNDILNNILTTIDIENNETQILLTDIQNTITNIDTNLTNIITNTQVLIDKLNKPCGVDNINVNVCNLETEKAIDTFQVSDCEGNNIGTPQEVKKTVVLNRITTNICNVQELADAINATTTYNNVQHYLLDNTNPILIIPANTVHSISYKIINATVDISIDGVILPYVLGESDMEEATTLIANEYIFDATNGKVKIKTIN